MNKNLIKINLTIALILLTGFALVAWLGNRTNYSNSIKGLEQVTALTANGIYYQLSQMLNKPVNVVLTMAHDTLLISHLQAWHDKTDEKEYAHILANYLEAYHKEDNFDSVFLVSSETGHYYSYKGFDRIISPTNKEDIWYYNFLDSNKDYELNVDNNKESGAEKAITVFINARVEDQSGKTVGVIGIGIKVDYLKQVILNYERDYGVDVFFINQDGKIEVSSSHTGVEDQDIFALTGMEKVSRSVLQKENAEENEAFWVETTNSDSVYFVTRYMPSLSWYVVISNNASKIIHNLRSQLFGSLLILIIIMSSVIFIISMLIKRFNKNIATIIDQRHELFKKATEVLYDDILEWNIDKNCYVDKNTRDYLTNLGARNPSYDESIRLIAEKQLHPDFRKDYLTAFNRKNIIEQFKKGVSNLQYDLRATKDGSAYHWLRIDCHIFYSPEDDSLHMFTYRKNIDDEKHKEFLANTDEMTGCYTKTATERIISDDLESQPKGLKAFFILDIDNFKQANDHFGHAFGDLCIKNFASEIKSHFRENDVIGRLGGDEFAVFLNIPNVDWLIDRAYELSKGLHFMCKSEAASWQVSASIGVAIYPKNGRTFAELYRKADNALYKTKMHGKNGVSFAE